MVGETVVTRFLAENSSLLKGISDCQNSLNKYMVFASNTLEKIERSINKMNNATITGAQKVAMAVEKTAQAQINAAARQLEAEAKLNTSKAKLIAAETRRFTQSNSNYHIESRNTMSMFQHYTNLGAQLGFLVRQYLGLFAVFSSIKKVLSEGMGFNKFTEETTMAFTVMMKSADEAKMRMEELYDFAVKSPLTFKETAEAARQLMAYGFQANELVDSMKMLGTVGKAVGASMQDMAYTYGTLRAQNHAYSRDLMQFSMRGIPIYEELAKVLDVNISKIQKLTEDGKVGFKEVEQAFINMTSKGGRFGGMLEAYMKTFAGKMSMLADLFQKSAGVLTERMFAVLKNTVDTLIVLLEDPAFTNTMKNLGQDIGLLVAGLVKVLEIILKLYKPLAVIGTTLLSFKLASSIISRLAKTHLPLMVSQLGSVAIAAKLTGASFLTMSKAMLTTALPFVGAQIAVATLIVSIFAAIKALDSFKQKQKEIVGMPLITSEAKSIVSTEYLKNLFSMQAKFGVEAFNTDNIGQAGILVDQLAKKYGVTAERIIKILELNRNITKEMAEQLRLLSVINDRELDKFKNWQDNKLPLNAEMPKYADFLEQATGIDSDKFTKAITKSIKLDTGGFYTYIKSYEVLGNEAAKLYVKSFDEEIGKQKKLSGAIGEAFNDEDIKKALETELNKLKELFFGISDLMAKEGKNIYDSLEGKTLIAEMKQVNTELEKMKKTAEAKKLLEDFDKYTEAYLKFKTEEKDSTIAMIQYEQDAAIRTAEKTFANDKKRFEIVKKYIDEEYAYKIQKEQIALVEQMRNQEKMGGIQGLLNKGLAGGVSEVSARYEALWKYVNALPGSLNTIQIQTLKLENLMGLPGQNVKELEGYVAEWKKLGKDIQALLPELLAFMSLQQELTGTFEYEKELLSGTYALEIDKITIFDKELEYKKKTLQAIIDANGAQSASARNELANLIKIGALQRKNLQDQINLTRAKKYLEGESDESEAFWNRVTVSLASSLGMKKYENGTSYVPSTGPAILHKGEAVIPANINKYQAGVGLTGNIDKDLETFFGIFGYMFSDLGKAVIPTFMKSGIDKKKISDIIAAYLPIESFFTSHVSNKASPGYALNKTLADIMKSDEYSRFLSFYSPSSDILNGVLRYETSHPGVLNFLSRLGGAFKDKKMGRAIINSSKLSFLLGTVKSDNWINDLLVARNQYYLAELAKGRNWQTQDGFMAMKAMGYANGTGGAKRGPAIVGEKGPELVYMNGGETVIPNHMLNGYADGAGFDNSKWVFPPDTGKQIAKAIGESYDPSKIARYIAGQRIKETAAIGLKIMGQEGSEVGKVVSGGAGTIITSLVKSLGGMLGALDSVNKILNPITVVLQGVFDVIGPAINEALAPLIQILTSVGNVIGKLMLPAIKLVGTVFTWIHDKVFVPVANAIIDVINGLIGLVNLIPGINIAYLEHLQTMEDMQKQAEKLATGADSLTSTIEYFNSKLKEEVDKQLGSYKDLYELGLMTAAEYENNVEKTKKLLPPEQTLVSAADKAITDPEDMAVRLYQLMAAQERIDTTTMTDAEKIKLYADLGLVTVKKSQSELYLQQLQGINTSMDTKLADVVKNTSETANKVGGSGSDQSAALTEAGVQARLEKYQAENAPAWWDLIGQTAWNIEGALYNLKSLEGKDAFLKSKGYAVGTSFVPSDMMANIHQGEMIVPRTFSDSIRSGELSLSSGQSSGGGVYVTVNVNGSVTAERDLAVTISKEIRKQTVRGYV